VRKDGGVRALAVCRALLGVAWRGAAGAGAREGAGPAARAGAVLAHVAAWARGAGAAEVHELGFEAGEPPPPPPYCCPYPCPYCTLSLLTTAKPSGEGEEAAWWGAAGAPAAGGDSAGCAEAEEAARLPLVVAVWSGCLEPLSPPLVVHLHADAAGAAPPPAAPAPAAGASGAAEEALAGAEAGLVALGAWMAALEAARGVGVERPRALVPPLPPYCCPYPCPYCTLPPSLPTVAPTRVPTAHSLTHSLLLPLPVSLLYTHSLPP